MIAALAPILAGDLAPFAETLVLAHDPRPALAGRNLLDDRVLARIMARAAGHFGGDDRRALVSLWSIDYVHVLMPVVVVADLLLDRGLPVVLDRIDVILGEDGRAAAIRLAGDGVVRTPATAFERFEPLIRGHLAPLFDVLARHGGLSPRVLWTNAANLYEAILRRLEQRPDVPTAVIAEAKALIASAIWPDGRRNPFHRPVAYRDGLRWRRVCCVRYLIPRYRYCSNCPHLLASC